MMKLNCMIVDDELLARKSLQRLCSNHKNLEVVSVCENAKEALDYLNKDEVDLVFLDVEMPEMSGIEFLSQMVSLPQVILTTSSTQYAFEAFQYQVTDYLKKPFTPVRFNQALDKILQNQITEQNAVESPKEFYIKKDSKYIRINFDDILYFENAGDYVGIRTTTESHIIHGTMKGLNDRIKSPKFLKVHRSYIVNLEKIKDIEDNTLIIAEKVIPVSRAHKPLLMSRLNII